MSAEDGFNAENGHYVDPDCRFCTPVPYPHLERYGVDSDIIHEPVLRTDHFICRPDIFPNVADGHFLVYPTSHGLYNHASAHMIADEMGAIRHDLEMVLGGSVVAFEHGDIGEDSGASIQSVRHAHTHLMHVPHGHDIVSYMSHMLSGGLDGTPRPHSLVETPSFNPAENMARYFKGHPYLFMQQGRLGIWLDDDDHAMPSQCVQRSMHEWASGVRFDWKRLSDPAYDEEARLAIQRVFSIRDRCRHRNGRNGHS